jgi:hypothetical protein
LTLPSLPEWMMSCTAYAMGWKRVHTALTASAGAPNEAPCRLAHSQMSSESGDPLHEEQLLVLCNRDELVELF